MKNMDKIFRNFLVPTAILFAAMGCSPDISSYCKDVSDCYNGNEYDEDACVTDMKTERKVADIYGCKTQFEDEISCWADNGRCETVEYGDYGMYSDLNYYNDNDLCAAQDEAYDMCMVGADAAVN